MQKRSVVAVLVTILSVATMAFSQNVGGGNPHGQGSLAVPVSGSLIASSPLNSLPSGSMTGVFNITNFTVQNDATGTPKVTAVGNLVATVTDTTGKASTVVANNVTAPVDPTGSCPILS